jgi:hypothetical protein
MKITTGAARLLPAIGLMICAAGSSSATSIPINNNSFEALTVTYGSYLAQDIPGWTFTGFVSTYHPATTEISSGIDGTNVAAVTTGASIWQVLGANLTGNTAYTLKVGVAERSDIASPGYEVDLFAGTNLLASESSETLIAGSFITSTISYNALMTDPNLGQALMIKISVGGVSGQTDVDNVRLDAAAVGAPEPSTFAIFGIGLVGLELKRRQSRLRALPKPFEP